jgi:hypothetical protein
MTDEDTSSAPSDFFEVPAGAAVTRRDAARAYAGMLEEYSATTNPSVAPALDAAPGAITPLVAARRVPQCGVTTSESNSEATCASVRKVPAPQFQHNQQS